MTGHAHLDLKRKDSDRYRQIIERLGIRK